MPVIEVKNLNVTYRVLMNRTSSMKELFRDFLKRKARVIDYVALKDISFTVDKGEVVAIESVIDSMRDARRSCSDLPQMDLITADVSKWITQIDEDFEVVILDPPRAGAGLDVITELNRITKREIGRAHV